MKEILAVVSGLGKRLETERMRLLRLRDYRARLGSELSEVRSPDRQTSKLESLTVSILDCEALIRELTDIYVLCRSELCSLIDRVVDDEVMKAVLTERCVFGTKFKDIGQKLGYSEVHIYRIYHKAEVILKEVRRC